MEEERAEEKKPEENKEILGKVDDAKKSVGNLKDELNSLNKEKESWFAKKDEYAKQIAEKIAEIKVLKRERDEFTAKVKGLKEERNKLNEVIRGRITEIKKINEQKKKIMVQYKITKDPAQIARQIDSLEMSIETEAFSFDKEKKVMKLINQLRKDYEGAKKLSSVWENSNVLSKEIDALKAQVEELHRKIQELAGESQKRHERMLEIFKEVDEIKKQEEGAYEKFFEYKKKFSTVNSNLKSTLMEISQSRRKLESIKGAEQKERKRKDSEVLKEKEEAVEEKIKKGKKLTTQDLLVFQKLESEKKEPEKDSQN